jgi:hypothetical protein
MTLDVVEAFDIQNSISVGKNDEVCLAPLKQTVHSSAFPMPNRGDNYINLIGIADKNFIRTIRAAIAVSMNLYIAQAPNDG